MTIKQTHELKQLQSRLAKADAEVQAAKQEAKVAQKRESDAWKVAERLRRQIDTLMQSARSRWLQNTPCSAISSVCLGMI